MRLRGQFGNSIAKCEGVVCNFFKHSTPSCSLSKHAKKVQELFQKNAPLDFVFCEGSLKQDLLGEFDPLEKQFFQQTKQGAKNFCQVAEFFMNAFKFGQCQTLSAAPYIQAISGKSFQPYAKSTVYYPASYKELYSLDGEYAKAVSPVFKVTGTFDQESKITTMSLEMKP